MPLNLADLEQDTPVAKRARRRMRAAAKSYLVSVKEVRGSYSTVVGSGHVALTRGLQVPTRDLGKPHVGDDYWATWDPRKKPSEWAFEPASFDL